MMSRNQLRGVGAWLTAAGICCLLAPGRIEARSKKAPTKVDVLLKQGQAAELTEDWDKALDCYIKAVAIDPSDIAAQLYMRRARFQAGQKHVAAGQKLRAAGKLADAIKEFETAIYTDPASSIALQELKTTKSMMEEGAKPGAPPESLILTPFEREKKAEADRASRLEGPPELKPITRRISALKMNNQPPKVLFETVGKLAGINVIFDPQYQSQGKMFNVDLNNSSLDQALDYLAVLTHTFWKAISSNTIFIAEDNIQKRRDYEDEVVKVFYVTNATSVQEFQEIATAVRSVIELRRVFTYNAQKALLVRGTVDQVALAEKLIQDLDKPKAEVVVDFLVMEVNTTHTRNLAATIFASGLNTGATFLPQAAPTSNNNNNNNNNSGGTPNPPTTGGGNPTPTSGALTLGQLGHISINDWSTTLPNALVEAVLNDNKTRVLQSPQVRASDGMKVSQHIGQKIPYATGSFQPGVGTVGVSPLVSTQFNFAEVGVNVDLTPQVHGTDEVTLHVEVEVSNVANYVNLGGISEPVIAQQKNTADIRLHEGELNLLGGLSQITDSKTVSGLPGFTNIPILGHLFGSETAERDRTELLIAVVPHIVRTPNYTRQNLETIAAGNDQVVKLSYAPKHEPPAAAPPKPVATLPVAPPPPPATPAPQSPAAQAGPRLIFMPSAVSAAVGAPVNVAIRLEQTPDLFQAPIKIKFDPRILRLNDVAPGDLLTRDNQKIMSTKDIRNDSGEATLTLSRVPGSKGISGSGTLATLSFTAVGQGSTQIAVIDLALKNSQMQPIAVTPPPLNVVVQ